MLVVMLCAFSLFAGEAAVSAEFPEPAPKRYIITGGPGVGKTSVIKYFEEQGCRVAHEAATDLIREELAKGADMPWAKEDFINPRDQQMARCAGEAKPDQSVSGLSEEPIVKLWATRED